MKEHEKIAKFWDAEASQWRNHNLLGDAKSSVVCKIGHMIQSALLNIPAEGLIVDLGSGSGNIEYFDRAQSGRKVICTDISQSMLKANPFRDKIQMSLDEDLPFRDESIALCTSIFTMRYLRKEDHISLLKNIWRILEDGGRFLIVDLPRNDYRVQRSWFDSHKLASVASTLGFESVIPNVVGITYSTIEQSGFGDSHSIEVTINTLEGVKNRHKKGEPDLEILDRYVLDDL